MGKVNILGDMPINRALTKISFYYGPPLREGPTPQRNEPPQRNRIHTYPTGHFAHHFNS
jgi:hypothetical protein